MNIMAVDSGANILYLWTQSGKSTTYSSKPSSSSNEPQHRKKRCRICRQPSFQFLVSDDQTKKVSLCDETPLNAFSQGLESTRLPTVVKNHGKLQRKRVAGIRRNLSNTGSISSLFNSWAPGSTRVTHLTEKNVGSTSGDVQKFGAIAKEIDVAISRIESLIPSLQKLVNSARTPNQTCNGDSGSVRNFTTRDESVLSKQVNRMLRISSDSASLSPNQGGNVRCVHNDVLRRIAFLKNEDKPEMDYAELISENIAQTFAIQPLFLHVQRSQDPELKAKGATDGLVSLQQASSGVKSVASQNPEHIQGLRIMPSQSDMERLSPSQNNSREGIGKDVVIALKPNRMNNLGESDHETISGCATSRYMLEKSGPSSSRRKNISGVSLSKSLQYFGGSEESSVGSSSSSSGGTLESVSRPSSTRTYETTSEGYESEEQRGEDNSSQAYGDLYYSSADQYSDASHSSLNARQSFRRGRHFELDKGVGKLRRFKNKLGKIFYHHHHHHHHHHYINDGEAGYMRSFWRRLGGMFHHTRKSSDREKPKADNLRKSVIKTTPNEKGHGGHFRALFKGLGSHIKHSKKPKDDIERLRTSLHGSMHKKAVEIKVPNSRMVKLVKKTKRPSLAVPKRILRQ